MEAADLQQRTERVKEVGRQAGALVVGVAEVSAFDEYVPQGHRPGDILPGARSVVVAAARGPTNGAWRSPNHRVMEVAGYDFRENVAIHVMADFIERECGYYAIQASALSTAGHHPSMSMMLAAVLAGLGTRSFAANIILNPKYGLLYYAACITTLPLQPDHRLQKDVCPHPMCVVSYGKLGKTPCMSACPADGGGCLDGSIDEKGRIERSYYDRERCASRAMNFGINSLQKALLQIVTEDDKEKRRAMIYSDFLTRSGSAISFYKESVAQCFECMRVCEELFAFAKKNGALVVGVADAEAFGEAPEGHRPADLLPAATRVVVVGGSPPRAGDWLSPNPQHMETTGTSDRVNTLGVRLAHFIESRFGYYALFVPPGADKGNQPFMSVMMAAEQAGCGSRSLAGPLLHPYYGLMYYSAVFTTLPLPADKPLNPPACPAPECEDMWEREGFAPCLSVCPINNGGCLGGRLQNGRIVERRYDRARCTSRVYTHWVPGFQKLLEATLRETDKERQKMILYSSMFTRTLWSMTYASISQGQCYECMRVCPVGKEYRTKK